MRKKITMAGVPLLALVVCLLAGGPLASLPTGNTKPGGLWVESDNPDCGGTMKCLDWTKNISGTQTKIFSCCLDASYIGTTHVEVCPEFRKHSVLH